MKKIILLLLLSQALVAQTSWYVSQESGSDSNNGKSPTTPFQSVNKAVNKLNPDDTLFFMGIFSNDSYDPNYTYNGDINDPHIWTQENSIQISQLNGTPGHYITLKAYDENTVFKGDGANILRVTNSSYLVFDGIEIEGEVNQISLATAKALQFLYKKDGTVHYRVPPGTTDEQVANMTFPKLNNIKRPSYTDTRGLYFTGVNHLDIKNMVIHHMPGGGLRVANSSYVNIIGNEVHDCSRKSYSGTHGFVVTKTQNFDNTNNYKINIIGNKVHHNFNEIYSWAPSKTFINPHIDEGKGISLQRNDQDNGWTKGRILIANNLAYWNGFSGIHSNSGERIDIINNTCYFNSYTHTTNGTSGGGSNIGISASKSDNIKIYNNVSVIDSDLGKYAISVANTTNLLVNTNMIFGHTGQDPDLSGIQVNTMENDPLFVDPAAFDFALQSGSPAIGAANTNFAVADDYTGATRDDEPDLGALEYFAPDAILDALAQKLKCYPNPFSDVIYLTEQSFAKADIHIISISGRNFDGMVHWASAKHNAIDTHLLPKGIYILTIQNQSALLVKG